MKFLFCLSIILLLQPGVSLAQQNFSYTPEQPKPGEIISFAYEPGGDIANSNTGVELIAYQLGAYSRKTDDIELEKKAGKYYGTIKADTGTSFIYLAFKAGKRIDNNFNEGFTIIFYNNDKPASTAYANLASFHQFLCRQSGVEPSLEKALLDFESEFKYHPENTGRFRLDYIKLKIRIKKQEAPEILQNEIEAHIKTGLNDEPDYTYLENLYSLAKLPNQQKLITACKKEKFPAGAWTITELIEQLNNEPDIERKKLLLGNLAEMTASNEKWKSYQQQLPAIKLKIAFACINNKDWLNLQKVIAEGYIPEKTLLAGMYNDAANAILETKSDLGLAVKFAKFSAEYYKELCKNPTKKNLDFVSQKTWEKDNKGWYAIYADTYARALFANGEYLRGYSFAKEAALTINNGNNLEMNVTYAMLAEKALTAKQYMSELEQFVINGKYNQSIIDILQRSYSKKKSAENFNDYVNNLKQFSRQKLIEAVEKTKVNEKAPDFTLYDLSGKQLSLSSLKGKIVVLDFWATWCGPCKASFPAMETIISKYKNQPDVVFLFIATLERSGSEKEKNINGVVTKGKYSFRVLMDNDDIAAELFKISGLPTKLVIDKSGNIRFRSVGFEGSDEKLMDELTTMIQMANE